MSINHHSSQVQEAHRWSQRYLMDDSSSANPSSSSHPKPLISTVPRQLYASAAGPMFCPQNTAFVIDLNNDDDEDFSVEDRENNIVKIGPRQAQGVIPKEPLFEKPLTPSDVGKLNRLVIPKQHAEKCFPLNGGDSGENGLLLSFEDEVGKSWRFRYSYWNSSQSYVLTKGWSRFVKEKRLNAGDIVVFARHHSDAGRLFIGWRRRNSWGGGQDHTNLPQQAAAVASGGWNRVFYSGHLQHQGPPSLPHQPDCLHAGSVLQNQTTSVSGNSKRLRLFGVNLECRADEYEPSIPVGSPVSSQGQGHHLHTYHQHYPNHMGATFSGGDAYRQG